ncbi:MAG: DUF302 domain-containing protein [Thermoanaerobaculia bacterium]|nr:MAG: DUF302 domain-containing protein [Thermoanaerobaculia bacterium]
MNQLYVREAQGSVDVTGLRLEAAVQAHKFGVIGVIDLKGKMAEKGVAFDNECRIFEVCNPVRAKQVLTKDMRIATALPCRIAVYEEGGKVKVATLLPTETLRLFAVPELEPVAQEIETEIKAMIDEATRG